VTFAHKYIPPLGNLSLTAVSWQAEYFWLSVSLFGQLCHQASHTPILQASPGPVDVDSMFQVLVVNKMPNYTS
jgi:hypothetical protein